MAHALDTREGCQQAVECLLEDLPPRDFGRQDLALMNLLCAPILDGSESLDIPKCLARLDRLTAYVKSCTERGLPNFRKDPRYGHCEPLWRMALLVTRVKLDFGVSYDPDVKADIQAGRYSPFIDSYNVFIHGLLADDPDRRWGCCCSIPVLITAVARRLGYPVGLASTRRHLYAKWDNGQGFSFNIEASNDRGMTSLPDDHYRGQPFNLDAEAEASGAFLRTLYPVEEFGCFVHQRASCLCDTARYSETLLWSARSLQFCPDNPHFPFSAYLGAEMTIKHRYRQLYPDRKIPPLERSSEFSCDLVPLLAEKERSNLMTILAHCEETKGDVDRARNYYVEACRQNRWGRREQPDLQRFLKKYNLKPKPGPLMPPEGLGQLRQFKLFCRPEHEADLLRSMAEDFKRSGEWLRASFALQDLYLFDPCRAELYEEYRAVERHPICKAQMIAYYRERGRLREEGRPETAPKTKWATASRRTDSPDPNNSVTVAGAQPNEQYYNNSAPN